MHSSIDPAWKPWYSRVAQQAKPQKARHIALLDKVNRLTALPCTYYCQQLAVLKRRRGHAMGAGLWLRALPRPKRTAREVSPARVSRVDEEGLPQDGQLLGPHPVDALPEGILRGTTNLSSQDAP